MGLFSGIVSWVKKVIKSVLTAIAKLFNGIFGSPLIAALAMFVVGFMVMGPAAFAAFAGNPLLYLSQCLTLTMMVGTSMVLGGIVGAISAVCPDLGKVLGFAFGIISFLMTGFMVLEFFNPAFAAQLASYTVSGLSTVGLNASMVLGYMQTANAVGMAALVAGLMAGTNSDGSFKSSFVDGYVDGTFFIPEKVAEVADEVVETATSSIWGFVGMAAAVFLGYKFVTAGSSSTRVVLADERGVNGD